jgi:hypothetical protein
MRRAIVLLPLLVVPLLLIGLDRAPSAEPTPWFAADATEVGDCAPERIDCLRQALANIAYREGGRRALARLGQVTVPGGAVDQACHTIVHAIGGAVYARTLSIGPAFADGGPECGYGFYHGVVEQAFSRDGIDPAGAASACAALVDLTAIDQCSHGAGHAFGSVGSPAEAAERCLEFAAAGPQVSRGSCYAGAFMEGFVGALGPPRWDEGAAACRDFSASVRPSCYGQAAIAVLTSPTGGGVTGAAELCETLVGDDRVGCTEGWSSQLAGRDGWREGCALAGDADATCARSVGEMAAVFRMPEPTLAIDQCEREFAGDTRLTSACAEGVGRRIERERCASFVLPDAIVACRRGYDAVER